MNLTTIKTDEGITLKRGRKIYATISENKNPDYKFVLFLRGGIALSGFETSQKAIDKANEMNDQWNKMIDTLTQ